MSSRILKKKGVCHYGPTNIFCIGSPISELEMTCCPNGLHSLNWKSEVNIAFDPKIDVHLINQKYHDNGYTYKPAIMMIEWLKEYFTSPQSIHLVPYPPICSSVTSKGSFQEKVWHCLAKEVPFGLTVSYGQLAKMVQQPLAFRAVGQAMKNNPVPLVIPCHRVIKSDGTSGHYSGGKLDEIKKWLISYEKMNC